MCLNLLLIKVRLIIEFIFILNHNGIFLLVFYYYGVEVASFWLIICLFYHGALHIPALVVLGHELLGFEDLLGPLMIFFPVFNLLVL